jgi:hypothetical protein
MVLAVRAALSFTAVRQAREDLRHPAAVRQVESFASSPAAVRQS